MHSPNKYTPTNKMGQKPIYLYNYVTECKKDKQTYTCNYY